MINLIKTKICNLFNGQTKKENYVQSDFKCGIGQGSLIESKGKRYKTHRWNLNGKYTLEFEDVSEEQRENFFVNPEKVKELIKTNQIKVV